MAPTPATRRVREVVHHFRDAAAHCPSGAVRGRLQGLADELDRLAGDSYWRSSKGARDLERLHEEVEDLRAALAACEEDDASQRFCTDFFTRLEHLVEHVQTVEAHE
ncbi:MAG: hypothetical protein Kow0092_12320 [Deferrisomatales bacterium]